MPDYRFSRRTVLAAIDVLESLSQARLSRYLLELGRKYPQWVGGEGISVTKRLNNLMGLIDQDPGRLTDDSEPLLDKIVEKAVSLLRVFKCLGRQVPPYLMMKAHSCAPRGPKHRVKNGKTPVLIADEARGLLDSIDTSTVMGLRDSALIAVMAYTFARVGAATAMLAEDYFIQGHHCHVRLHEKGGIEHVVPAHHHLDDYMEAYI
jgi:integrase